LIVYCQTITKQCDKEMNTSHPYNNSIKIKKNVKSKNVATSNKTNIKRKPTEILLSN